MEERRHALAIPFDIRMEHAHLPCGNVISFEEAAESLAALRSQELAYKCRSYIDRWQWEFELRREYFYTGTSFDDESAFFDDQSRRRMCEWCYKICERDEFPLTREMVAVSFSFLDRFLDRRPKPCNRAIYKLLVVTCFYIATKIMSSKQISISSLVFLGRGAYKSDQIEQMERLILSRLDWRLCPPTVQAIVGEIRILFVEYVDVQIIDNIVQRAIFYGEIAVFDHFFVSYERYELAVACLLNAIEYVKERESQPACDISTLVMFEEVLAKGLDKGSLDKVRERLWMLYKRTTQSCDDEKNLALRNAEQLILSNERGSLDPPRSPRSVDHLNNGQIVVFSPFKLYGVFTPPPKVE